MPDHNQNTPAEGEKHENPQGGNAQSRKNRNRYHRGNNNSNRPRPDASAKENRSVSNDARENKPNKPSAPQPQNRPQKQRNNNSNQPRNTTENGASNNAQKKNNRPNGNRGRGNQSGNNPHSNRGYARHERESRAYDPYETPSKQEIELSELRAQIVLKSADGTHPTAYSASPAPKAEEPETVTAAAMTDEPPITPAPDIPSPVTENVPKVEVVGVRFRSSGKMYYFDPHGIQAKKGDFAIVETTRGPEFGDVCLGNSMVNAKDTVSPLRPLLRIATPDDIARNAENREKEKNALAVCQQKIREHRLEMKLIDVQYAFDGSKLLFYFSADGRVDFRDLVKDLASVFRTRIELRQIGIRDEAKLLGGIGACGRSLCCTTFLPDFAQVSIKMAKDQNLSLNSSKISGVCGRLMCCLRYESEVYAEEIRRTPANDTVVRTEDGVGTVIGSNPLAGTVRVVLKDSPDTAPKQYHRDSVTVLGKEKKGACEPKNHTEK